MHGRIKWQGPYSWFLLLGNYTVLGHTNLRRTSTLSFSLILDLIAGGRGGQISWEVQGWLLE